MSWCSSCLFVGKRPWRHRVRRPVGLLADGSDRNHKTHHLFSFFCPVETLLWPKVMIRGSFLNRFQSWKSTVKLFLMFFFCSQAMKADILSWSEVIHDETDWILTFIYLFLWTDKIWLARRGWNLKVGAFLHFLQRWIPSSKILNLIASSSIWQFVAAHRHIFHIDFTTFCLLIQLQNGALESWLNNHCRHKLFFFHYSFST